MWVNVVLLRDRGRRLTAAEVQCAQPLAGRLSVDQGHERWDRRHGERARGALLYDPGATRGLAELHRVELVKITSRGMVLAGLEEVFARRGKEREVYRQAWWCWPAALTTDAVLVSGTPDERAQLDAALWPPGVRELEPA